MKTPYKLIIILCMSLLLTGCWDLIEIDQYFFISAMGIDIYKGEELPTEETGMKPTKSEITQADRFVVTYCAPDLRAVGKNSTSDNPRIILSSISNNPYETTRELSTRSTANFTFRHTKAVLIGEDVAKNEDYMREIFDNLGRHEQLSRKINVLIVEGTAKEIIETEDILNPVTGYLIEEIVEKKQGTERYNDMVLEEVLTELYFNGDVLMPRAEIHNGETKVAGSAIIKDFKLIGWLEEIENVAAMYLMDRVRTSLVIIEHDNVMVPYVITNSKTKCHIKSDGDKIKYIANIDTEGYIQQYKLGVEKGITDQGVIMGIEKHVEEVMEKQIASTFNKLQKEFKVDAIGLGRYIRKHNPELWEQVKDNWDEVFQNIELEVNVDASLRRIGMIK